MRFEITNLTTDVSSMYTHFNGEIGMSGEHKANAADAANVAGAARDARDAETWRATDLPDDAPLGELHLLDMEASARAASDWHALRVVTAARTILRREEMPSAITSVILGWTRAAWKARAAIHRGPRVGFTSELEGPVPSEEEVLTWARDAWNARAARLRSARSAPRATSA